MNIDKARFEDILMDNQSVIVENVVKSHNRHEIQLFRNGVHVASRVITSLGTTYFFPMTVAVFYKNESLLQSMSEHFKSPVFFEVNSGIWALDVMPYNSAFAINDTRFGVPVVVQVLFNDTGFKAVPLRLNVAVGDINPNVLDTPQCTVYLSDEVWPRYKNCEIIYTCPEGNGNPVLINHSTGERWVLDEEFNPVRCL